MVVVMVMAVIISRMTFYQLFHPPHLFSQIFQKFPHTSSRGATFRRIKTRMHFFKRDQIPLLVHDTRVPRMTPHEKARKKKSLIFAQTGSKAGDSAQVGGGD